MAVPADADDLTRLVEWARSEGRPLIPRGAGTGMPGGNVGPGVVVDLTRSFDAVGDVDDEGRIRVGAGAVAAAVDARARSRGLFLPALPSSADRCTLGGMVANNAAGARSFKYGAVREWIRELEVVLADGRRVRLRGAEGAPDPFPDLRRRLRTRWSALADRWPRVRKNASGYALDRFVPVGDPVQLLTGSEGTLALVTGMTLDLSPLPAARALALIPAAEPADLVAAVRAAGEADASACEFFGRRFLEMADLADHPRVASLAEDAFALLLVEVDGGPSDVEDGLERLGALARELDAPIRVARSEDERNDLWTVRHAASPTIARAAERGLRSTQFIEDSVVPPERLPDYLLGLDRIFTGAGIDAVVFGHAGDANVHVNPLIDVRRDDWRDRVRDVLEQTVALVADLGGTLTGEHGDGRVRAPFIDRIWPEVAVDAFREVKETLDPEGILNPGVVLPLSGQDPLEGLAADLPEPRASGGGTMHI